MKKRKASPLAIVGISCLFPKADNLQEYWANLKAGVDAITPIPATHWNPADYFDADPKSPDMTYAKRGGFLSPFPFSPMEYGISPNDIEATDTSQLLGLVAAKQALIDAGYYKGSKEFDRERASVVLGVTGTLELVIPLGARLGHPLWRRALLEAGVSEQVSDQVVQKVSDSYVGWKEASFPGLLGNVVAGRIANRLDFGGTNCVVDAACASSLSAIHLAALELDAGRSDLVVTGGVDTFNDIFMYMCFSKTPALSPTGDSRPFDAKGNGTILGEGIGMLVLKRLADAERDKDRIYAVLKGVGSSSDGKGGAIYEPSAKGQARALHRAYELAGVTPDSIELVEAHGTGTPVGDATEAASLSEVYRASGREGTWCAVGSVKSMIGHTKAAAGVAGLIKAVMALNHKVLPPTIKVDRPSDALAPGETPFYVNTTKRPWLPSKKHPRRAGVSAFGFGGSNFHCLVEEYGSEKERVDWDGEVQLLAFSGPDTASLAAALKNIPADASWADLRYRAARSRAEFSPSRACRLIVVLEKGMSDHAQILQNAVVRLEKADGPAAWSTPDGVTFGSGEAPGRIAALFPGQGSQYGGMLRDLACAFPAMLETLAEADACFADANREFRLSDRIYPHPKFDEEARAADEKALRATEVAQPALGAVSLGAYRTLEGFGFSADAAAGHSYGELTALCAAGRIDAGTLNRLSILRGSLMADQGVDRGSMLAAQAPIDAVEAALKEGKFDLILANKNAPRQGVISGATGEIERAAVYLSDKGIRNVRLPVSAAFHSPLVADAQQPFEDGLKEVRVSGGRIPVFANSSAGVYPADAAGAKKVLAGQLAKPVEFIREIEAIYESGARVFVEIGPGARLTSLVKAILKGKPFEAISVDASSGARSGIADLGRVLARLASLGFALELGKWDGGFDADAVAAAKKPGFTVQLTGANHFPAKPAAAAPLRRPAAAPVAVPAAKNTLPAAPAPSAPPLPTSCVSLAAGVSAHLAALQSLQQQTARLHEKFLEGQEAAVRTIQSLITGLPAAIPAVTVLSAAFAPELPEPVPAKAELPAPATIPARVARGRASGGNTAVEKVLLEVVSEKTGYPIETLNLRMGLDSDLGIDSIKRVEILSALQEKFPEAPAIKPEHLGTLKTLGAIVEHLAAGMDDTPGQEAADAPPGAGHSAAAQDIGAALLAVVAEKTGYPAETLNLKMGLDSDLGIDSIKRVEILSALQQQFPNAPAIKPEHLGTLKTLGAIVEHLAAGLPAAAAAVSSADIAGALLEVVAEKTGYPAETLNLKMGLDSDLGIDSIKRVEILSALQQRFPSAPPIKPEHLGELKTLGAIVEHLGKGGGVPAAAVDAAPPADLAQQDAPESCAIARSVLGTIILNGGRKRLPAPERAPVWVSEDGDLAVEVVRLLKDRGLDARTLARADWDAAEVPAPLGGLVIIAPADADDVFSRDALFLAKKAAAGLRAEENDGRAFFVTVSRLDGAFGLGDLDAECDPAGGALAGLAKTAGHEWAEVSCKAFDVERSPADRSAAAAMLVDEIFLDGPSEVGLAAAQRLGLALLRADLDSGDGPREPLGQGDVLVVTGGARGVTAEAAVEFGRRLKPSLVLFGRSPEPAAEPAGFAALEDEGEMKRYLLEDAGGGLSPKELEARYRSAAANREMLRTLDRIRATGAAVRYLSVDIRDAAAVVEAVRLIESEIGVIKGLVHGAGVLADRLIEEKTGEQFDRVYGTKVSALRNLLAALDGRELKILALFSSSTGRFGRKGQVDYAMANEVLNKFAQREARRRLGCRVLSVNWGPWEGGMVTPALKKIFEAEGVGLIPLASGARSLIDELCSASGPVEVVVLGERPGAHSQTPMTAAFQRLVSVAEFPFLRSHVIDGKAVLPMAVIAEWLAHGAMHANPGLSFHGLGNLRILKGVILEAGAEARLAIFTGKPEKTSGGFSVPVELRGDPDERVHARGEILLTDALPKPGKASPALSLAPFQDSAAVVYDQMLFHGPDLQGILSIDGCSQEGIVAEVKTAPAPGKWMKRPLRSRWIGDPLALDCAFQLMIVWSRVRYGAGSLPVFAGAYRQFRAAFPKDGVRVSAKIIKDDGRRAVADIEFLDARGGVVAALEGYECVIDASLNGAFTRRQISEEVLT